jgi:hypothetical protein
MLNCYDRLLLLVLLPRQQPERLLPRLVIHLVGVDVFTAFAPAVDGPRTSLDFYLWCVTFVSREERSYGGFLIIFFYHMVVVHDERLSSVSGTSVDDSLSQSPLAL